MKILLQLLSILMVTGLTLISACKDDTPTAQELMTNDLTAHPWNLSKATVNGTDQLSMYTGLKLTFTKTGYTATNGTPIWPSSGTWKFVDDITNSTLIRNDDLTIEIVSISAKELVLSFNWDITSFEPGRIGSVSGNHVFTLVE